MINLLRTSSYIAFLQQLYMYNKNNNNNKRQTKFWKIHLFTVVLKQKRVINLKITKKSCNKNLLLVIAVTLQKRFSTRDTYTHTHTHTHTHSYTHTSSNNNNPIFSLQHIYFHICTYYTYCVIEWGNLKVSSWKKCIT